MRVPLRWLREYVDVELAPDDLAAALTMQGVAVEAVERRAAGFDGVVVGRVLSVEPHPNADRLRVCRVQVDGRDGQGRQIVCGAPNVAAGQWVPVALPGAELPAVGVRIEARALRGVASEGMICSARELGLPDPTEGAGILPLPELPLGADVASALELDDAVMVLELTPNYATHCQSMLGVAREVAALLGRPVRLPEAAPREVATPAAAAAEVRIDNPDLCPRYVARVIRGVRIGPSPVWMQRRLEAAGMRPINNVVDVTNYVMLEYGQPLHAFDLDRLRGGAGGCKEIIVRRARPGEGIVTLDGAERRLTADDLVIADGEGPVAVAGVMGGEGSEVYPDTVDILLESAHFHNLSVRRTARRLGIPSESSARFEKWVDPEGCARAADRAIALIQELAGGEVLAGVVDDYPRPAAPRTILARPERINGLLGTSLGAEEMDGIFRRLGFGVQATRASAVAVGEGGLPAAAAAVEALAVTVPTRRPDVEGEHDLAEEVARIFGYNRIPVTLPHSPAVPSSLSPERRLAEEVRAVCLAAGLHEVMTYSFMNPAAFDRLALPADDPRRRALPLANPLSEDQGVMRTLLLPLLLDVLAHNARHRQEDVAVFELGRVYLPDALPPAGLPREPLSLGLAVMGRVTPPSWHDQGQDGDYYYLKGLVEAVFRRLGVDGIRFEPASAPGYHPGRTARIVSAEGASLGVIGEVHPAVQAAYDLPRRVCAGEVDLAALIARARPVRAYRPLPRYPSSSRDLACLVREGLPAERVEAVIRAAGQPLLASVRLFDVYHGGHVPAGWRSLAYSLVYQAPDRTLTDAEVDEAHDRVRQALVKEAEAQLRS